MSLRTAVWPLGFALSGLAPFLAAAADEGRRAASPPPARIYTNADLDRVHPFRDETGASSVPAVAAQPVTGPARGDLGSRHGESYWRHEAEKVRDRVRALAEQADELRSRIAEQVERPQRIVRRGRARSTEGEERRLRARLAALERRARQLEEDLAERARREGALPGWLR